VVLQKQKRSSGLAQEAGDTVTAMRILDAAGSIQYQRTFPNQSEYDGFSDAWSVSASVLVGTNGSGLLVNYDLDSEPSAPEPEPSSWWQLLGVVNGKLKPFSGPLLVQGGLISDATNGRFRTKPLDARSDALEFKVWAHHFRLIFPVRVDWAEGKLSPAQSCRVCEYKVAPEDDRRIDSMTFVRLCPNPGRACEKPERVVVKIDSKVELVASQTAVEWSEGVASGPSPDVKNPIGDQGGIGVPDDDVWLKVRIDGREGWMHSVEDFTALDLPFEQ
jgi:hypothetical protein